MGSLFGVWQQMNYSVFVPAFVVWSADGRQPIGAAYGLGVPRARFWDPSDPDAKLLRGMEAAFPDDAVSFANGSREVTRSTACPPV